MNIRQAILRSAEIIEKDPRMFDFYKTRTPECGSAGCVIGLIMSLMGAEAGICVHNQIEQEYLQVDYRTFYDRIRELSSELYRQDRSLGLWTRDSRTCAKALLLYADKYHPAENFARDLAARLAMSPRIAEDA